MRHLDRHVGHAADGEQLVERLPELPVLAPHVADVPAARRAGDLCELEHLVVRRENPWVVFQARGQTQSPRRHLFPQNLPHPFNFRWIRRTLVVVAHDFATDRAVSDVRRDVDRRWLRVELAEKRSERESRGAVLSRDDRRYALRYGRGRVAMLGQLPVVMAVRVDESGRERQPVRVDDAIGRIPRPVSDCVDATVQDTDVSVARGSTRAVDDGRVDDECRLRLRAEARRGENDKRRDLNYMVCSHRSEQHAVGDGDWPAEPSLRTLCRRRVERVASLRDRVDVPPVRETPMSCMARDLGHLKREPSIRRCFLERTTTVARRHVTRWHDRRVSTTAAQ